VADHPIVSFVIESNVGGVAVTVCGCGALVLHSMASEHFETCPTMIAWEEARRG
jgi:hypothetical protein